MRDLDYRVMRNPQTLASWRRWLSDSARTGRPFTIIGMVCMLVGGVIEGWSLASAHSAALKAAAALLMAGPIVMGVGLWRVWRHRRLHPWVDPQA